MVTTDEPNQEWLRQSELECEDKLSKTNATFEAGKQFRFYINV